jgi:hypothetical protein
MAAIIRRFESHDAAAAAYGANHWNAESGVGLGYKSQADMTTAEHYGARGMDGGVWWEAYTVGDAQEQAQARQAAEIRDSGIFG